MSLRRLGVERIDLYQLHRIDPHGRRATSSSACSPSCRTRARSATSASPRSPWRRSRRPREHLRRWPPCRTATTSPTAQSEDVLRLLRASRASASSRGSRWRPASSPSPAAPVAEVAEAHGATPAQVALAWLLAQRRSMLPIPGTGSVAHLEENVRGRDLELDRDEVGAAGRRRLIADARRARRPAGGKAGAMLDLPSGITTCLFDLDGSPPDGLRCMPGPGKRCSTSSCAT